MGIAFFRDRDEVVGVDLPPSRSIFAGTKADSPLIDEESRYRSAGIEIGVGQYKMKTTEKHAPLGFRKRSRYRAEKRNNNEMREYFEMLERARRLNGG